MSENNSNGCDSIGGHTEGSTFLCSVCHNYIVIKNLHYLMGDKIDCKICNNTVCNNEVCAIECLHCQDRNICIMCSIICDGCGGYVCKEDDCVSMLTICDKCEIAYCDDCSDSNCKCAD